MMGSMILRSVAALFLLAVLAVPSSGVALQNACVIPGKGFFRVYADAGGLFSVFAHDHLIEAQKIEGCAVVDLQNPAQASVKLTFSTADLRVMDPNQSAEDRAKV